MAVLLRYTCAVVGIVLLSACVVAQERKAFSEYNSEENQYSVNDPADTVLPDLNETATLDDYIRYALLNNPGLRASFDQWKAAMENIAPARTLPDPRFTYANYIREVETRVGPQKHRFGLSQMFPWFGSLDLQGDMALQAANAARQRYEAEKLKLIYQVKKAYFEYWYLGRSMGITRDNITLVGNFENVAREKYRSGTGLQTALVKTQVELGKLEDRLRSQVDLVRPVVAKLNFTLNRPTQLPLPAPKELPEDDCKLSEDELKQILSEENPDLRVMDFLAAKDAAAVELAKKNYYPNVTVGVDYINTGKRADMNPDDNGKDPIVAMLSVNVPIWRKKYKALVDEAGLQHRATLGRRTEKENALFADLEMAMYQLRDAERKIDLYKDTLLPMAEQNVKVNQLAFATDKAGFLDLIDSQRIYLGFQLEHERALADRAQRIAEVEMLIGGDLNVNINNKERDFE